MNRKTVLISLIIILILIILATTIYVIYILNKTSSGSASSSSGTGSGSSSSSSGTTTMPYKKYNLLDIDFTNQGNYSCIYHNMCNTLKLNSNIDTVIFNYPNVLNNTTAKLELSSNGLTIQFIPLLMAVKLGIVNDFTFIIKCGNFKIDTDTCRILSYFKNNDKETLSLDYENKDNIFLIGADKRGFLMQLGTSLNYTIIFIGNKDLLNYYTNNVGIIGISYDSRNNYLMYYFEPNNTLYYLDYKSRSSKTTPQQFNTNIPNNINYIMLGGHVTDKNKIYNMFSNIIYERLLIYNNVFTLDDYKNIKKYL